MRKIALLILLVFLTSSAFGQTIEARAAFKKGYELLEQKKNYLAIDNLKIATQDTSFPLLDYSYYYIAEAYRQKNHRQEAIQVYNIVPKYFKNSILIPNCLIAMAELNADDQEYESAVKILQEFLAIFPKHESSPKARYLLGVYLTKLDRPEEAARVFRNLDLLHGSSYFAEKAIEQLDKLAKTTHLAGYEAPAASVYNLGIKYFKASDNTKAKEYFTRLSRFYKKSSLYDEAIMMLGRVALRQGKLDQAANYFKKAINLNQDSKPESMFYLARTYGYENDFAAAIVLLEKVPQDYPAHHIADDALYYLSKYYQALDQSEKAMGPLAQIIANYPASEFIDEATWTIGNNLYKKQEYKAAHDIFNKINSARTIFWSAKCADKEGQRDEAIKAYKLTITKFDHSYYAYRAREELKRFGIEIKVTNVPEVSAIADLKLNTYETITHEQKYQELLAIGLADQAATEAEFLEETVPAAEKDKAQLAKYHAYVMKGKYASPIHFADQKILEAMAVGRLDQLDPRFWRFSYPRGYWKYVEKYSKERGLDPYLTYAVIREESRFKSQALSRSSAHGLMQIIPSTGRLICRALGLNYSRWKMYEPRVNIEMGTYYLASLIKRFNGNVPLAVAGYNGGPVRVQKWVKQYKNFDLDEFVEDIPLTETRNYVKKVMKSYYGYKRTYSGI